MKIEFNKNDEDYEAFIGVRKIIASTDGLWTYVKVFLPTKYLARFSKFLTSIGVRNYAIEDQLNGIQRVTFIIPNEWSLEIK